jgi:hypothetical protein
LETGGAGDAAAILADTDELQGNQGDWATAEGFSTHSAADVVMALGTGSTLTDCLTATEVTLTAAYDAAKTAAQAGDEMTLADGAITAAKIAQNALAAAKIAADACNKLADHVLRRRQSSVEASSDGDTINVSSLYGAIQQLQVSNTDDNSGYLTIYQTDGSTELAQKAVATDGQLITGIS